MKTIKLSEELSKKYNGFYPGLTVQYESHDPMKEFKTIVVGVISFEVMKDKSILLHLFNDKHHVIDSRSDFSDEDYSIDLNFSECDPESLEEIVDSYMQYDCMTVNLVDGVN